MTFTCAVARQWSVQALEWSCGRLCAVRTRHVENLSVNEVASRVETFVTMGKPSPLTPSGKGLEVRYDTHPNDLVKGEPATLTFRMDSPHPSSMSASTLAQHVTATAHNK